MVKGKSYLLRAYRYDRIPLDSGYCFLQDQLLLYVYCIASQHILMDMGVEITTEEVIRCRYVLLLIPLLSVYARTSPDDYGVTTPSLHVKSVVIRYVRLTWKEM